MLNAKSLRQKKQNLGWLVVMALAGIALFFVYSQNPPALVPIDSTPAAATPAPQTEPADASADTAALPETAYLAEYDPANPAFETDDTDKQEWELGIDVVLKLALVLALVYVSMVGLRWLKKGKSHNLAGGATINVLETTGLAPGRSLHLVVVGEKTLLLGATDTHISLLAELPDAAVPLPEESPEFEQVISTHTHAPAPAAAPAPVPVAAAVDELPPHLKMLDDSSLTDEPVEYVPDWQAALAGMRDGIRRMQESAGG